MAYISTQTGLRVLRTPGPGGYGVCVFKDDKVVAESAGYLGPQITNNMCEYIALVAGLQWLSLSTVRPSEVTIHTDSLLVVKQINGDWTMHAAKLRPLWTHATKLLTELRRRGWTLYVRAR